MLGKLNKISDDIEVMENIILKYFSNRASFMGNPVLAIKKRDPPFRVFIFFSGLGCISIIDRFPRKIRHT